MSVDLHCTNGCSFNAWPSFVASTCHLCAYHTPRLVISTRVYLTGRTLHDRKQQRQNVAHCCRSQYGFSCLHRSTRVYGWLSETVFWVRRNSNTCVWQVNMPGRFACAGWKFGGPPQKHHDYLSCDCCLAPFAHVSPMVFTLISALQYTTCRQSAQISRCFHQLCLL